MLNPDIELLLDCRATIGESLTWSAPERALYWIDVKAPSLCRMDEAGAVRETRFEADIGAFALLDGAAGAVVALRTGLFRHDFASGATAKLAPPPFDPGRFRFNEGLCDAQGRFWVGVMLDPLPGHDAPPGSEPEAAALHRFTLGGGLVPDEDRSDLHNGMAWSADGRTLFLSHSNQGLVHRHPYDPDAGTLGPAQPFAVLHGSGVPDGAAMDEEGCYWCAVHGAGVLHRYDPGGRLVSAVPLPVSQPTMCAFTGTALDELVVSSAADKLTPAQLARQPHAGGLFRLRPGVRGIPRPCIVR